MNYTETQKQQFKTIFSNAIEGTIKPEKHIQNLSTKLAVPVETINEYLCGEAMPPYNKLREISDYLGISNSYLLNGKNLEISTAIAVTENFGQTNFIKYNDHIVIEKLNGEEVSGKFYKLTGSDEYNDRAICYEIENSEELTIRHVVFLDDISKITNLEDGE